MTTRTASRPNCFNIQSVARFFLKGRRHAQPGKTPALAGIVAFAAAALLTAAAPPAQAQRGPIQNEVAKLLADDGAANALFGYTVAMSGDTAIVGNIFPNSLLTGDGAKIVAAYVFTRDAMGVWTQRVKLLPDDGAPTGNIFSGSVAISGDTALVGGSAYNEDGDFSGAVYVFQRSAKGIWTQQVKLFAAGGTHRDGFGSSVAIEGDTAIAGARYGDGNNHLGSAYVFVRDANGQWTQQDKLFADDGQSDNSFGASISISGDTVVIGSPYDSENGNASGSAYVFVRGADGVWTQQAKLLASDGDFQDVFGGAVAIKDDTALVGAGGDDGDGTHSGSAYVFIRDASGVWTQQTKFLPDDGVTNSEFGVSVALDADMALVGAQGDNNNNGVITGSAHLFRRDAAGIWTRQTKLLASDGAVTDGFGAAAAISGDSVIIGAINDDDNGHNSGSAYIFNLRPADLNANGVVDGDDLSALLSQWGTDGGADLNADGVVDGVDLATLLTNWG